LVPSLYCFQPKMSKLPLNARKNLRDHWETKQTELVEKLKKASGADWTFTVDVEDFYNKIGEESRKVQIGQVIYWNFDGLVNNLVKKMGDSMTKQAILDACPKKTISLTIGEVKSSYHDVHVKDGGIQIVTKKDGVATNVDQIGAKIETQLNSSALPLEASKNIRDYWEKNSPALLKKLKDATGVDWKFDINFEKLHNDIDDSGRKKQVGQCALWCMEGLTNNIVKKSKDDMVKEAILDTCSTHTITYYVGDCKKTYHDIVFKDGVLHVIVKPSTVATNADQIGDKIEDLL